MNLLAALGVDEAQLRGAMEGAEKLQQCLQSILVEQQKQTTILRSIRDEIAVRNGK